MRYDVIIVGGGISGLATGALLAKRGLRTVVLEKGNQPGGRAYTLVEKGFTLNYGAHAIYRPETGLLAEVLRRLGKRQLPCNYPDASRAFWAQGDRFGSIGAKPHEVLTSKLFPFATKLRMAPLMLAIRRAKPETLPEDMRWAEWVDRQTGDELLRSFVLGLSVVNSYCRDAGELSARAMLKQLTDNLFARDYAGYMHGGWSRMYETFVDALRENGGELMTGSRVDCLETDGSHVTAAIVNHERLEARVFVLTTPPQDAAGLALDATPLAAEFARWSRLTDVRACCIDLGFSRRLRTDLTFIFDLERDLYFSLHSEVTPDLAPPGGQLLHAMAYLSPEDAASDAAAARRKDELTDGLDRFFPGWREAAVVERTLPNVRVSSARRTPGQYGANAMPLRSAAASNLYFANDARDLPYLLTLTCLAAALEVADTIADEIQADPSRTARASQHAVAV
jgi:phytoene dehydrogenase-like protein